jgi:phage baseplate assembly protein W
MAALSFKDVGVQFGAETVQTTATSFPIGFKTPLELDTENNSIFKMHYSLADQITDNLRNLILTNRGERLGLYDFGGNIRPLLTEFGNKEAFDQEAMKRIKATVSIYMPFVELIGYESKADRRENVSTGIIKLLIAYRVPQANLGETLMEVDMYIV